jgi:hypothetical protein
MMADSAPKMLAAVAVPTEHLVFVSRKTLGANYRIDVPPKCRTMLIPPAVDMVNGQEFRFCLSTAGTFSP